MLSRTVSTGAAAGVAVLVLSVAGTAAAAPTPSTPTAPIAAVLTGDGTTIATYRIAANALTPSRPITGLSGDTALVGIDVRVQDGRIHGVGNNSGLYLLGLNGAARKIKTLNVALSGTRFGVDVNPAANALRIVSDTGQNLRQSFVDVRTATVSDLPLSYAAGTTATGITSAAYTNNDLSADTGTTLFVVDSTLDQLAIQAPADDGTLSVTGKLGADVGPVGFDIFSVLDGAGRTTADTGYLVVPAGATTTLHTVDLVGGAATVRQTLAAPVGDIAIIPVGGTDAT